MTRDDSGDELLAALDHFTNTVYWLRAHTEYSAAEALCEALDDWTDNTASKPVEFLDDTGELRGSLAALVAASAPASTTRVLADALNAWSATVCAEHHHSKPFQPPTSRPVQAP